MIGSDVDHFPLEELEGRNRSRSPTSSAVFHPIYSQPWCQPAPYQRGDPLSIPVPNSHKKLRVLFSKCFQGFILHSFYLTSRWISGEGAFLLVGNEKQNLMVIHCVFQTWQSASCRSVLKHEQSDCINHSHPENHNQ